MSDRPAIVIDANVAIKWVLKEPGREEAVSLLDAYEAGTVDLIAPQLLMAEVASALSKRCRRGDMAPARAKQAFRLLEDRSPMLIDNPAHLSLALSMSLTHQISLWDALYLALAVERRCDLVTADRRFQRSIVKHYPFTRLIGV